jgi:hypothetical protein
MLVCTGAGMASLAVTLQLPNKVGVNGVVVMEPRLLAGCRLPVAAGRERGRLFIDSGGLVEELMVQIVSHVS